MKRKGKNFCEMAVKSASAPPVLFCVPLASDSRPALDNTQGRDTYFFFFFARLKSNANLFRYRKVRNGLKSSSVVQPAPRSLVTAWLTFS